MLKRKANTLLELSIYSLLLLVILTLAYNFYRYGNRYLHKTRAQIELQQSAALTGGDLARDLSEASSTTITTSPNTTNPAGPAGVVMVSARDQQGKFQYAPASGSPIWQRYVGYYLDTDPESPEDPNIQALFRAEITNRGGLPGNNASSPAAAGVTIQLLRTSGINRRLIAHGLRAASATNPHGGLDVYNLTVANAKSYPALLDNPIWVDLEFSNSNFAGHFLRTRLGVMSRN